MKKLLSIVLIFWSLSLAAQRDEVTNAFFFHKNGQLDKAKEAIDKASEHEKTKNEAKTWYFRGLIYESIYRSDNPEYQKLTANAGKETYAAFTKAMELDKPGSEYHKNSSAKIAQLWGDFVNEGVRMYQANNFPASMEYYELASKIRPEDTTAYLYGLYTAEQLKDYNKVLALGEKLTSLGRPSTEYYISRYRLSKAEGNMERALKDIEDGRKQFPGDRSLMLEELNLYFQLNRLEEVKGKLEKAIEADPNNANLLAVLGNLYDQESMDKNRTQAQRDESKRKALENYEKALKVDPENFESNYNMGVYYFNRGAEIMKKVNAMDLKDYQAKGKKAEADATAEFEKSLPFFEKCYKINPEDEGTRSSLKKVYTSLKREADAAKIK
jgi:tetratricopeptide (TPR) repeat protein